MSREIDRDFKELYKFVEFYEVRSRFEGNEAIKSSFKKMHKQYFGVLTWHAEMKGRIGDFMSSPGVTETVVFRFYEALSDISSALICWINSAYKPAKVMLRVAIENFVRGVGGMSDASLEYEKSVHVLIAAFRQQMIAVGNLHVEASSGTIGRVYGDLCNDVHTSSPGNMAHLSSLSDFSLQSESAGVSVAPVFVSVARAFNIIFVFIFSDFFFSMHHRNRENILDSFPSTVKAMINSGRN